MYNIREGLSCLSSVFLLLILLICGSTRCFAAEEELVEFLVSLQVNHEDPLEEIVHIFTDGADQNIYVPKTVLSQCDVRPEFLQSGRVKTIGDEEYLNIHTLGQVKSKLDRDNLLLSIDFPASAMQSQRMDAAVNEDTTGDEEDKEKRPAQATYNARGFFLNYDATLSRSKEMSYISGIPEFNYFTPTGTFTTNFLYKKRIDNPKSGGTQDRYTNKDIARLETNWTFDNEVNMGRLRIGDSVTKPADWSGSSRFAGIQYATNFEIKPGFIKYPLLNFRGSASLPTTLDVYNDAFQVYQTSVKTGDFFVDNLPITTGKGELIIKTKDISGRTETIVVPYYNSPMLLRPGLSEYSFETGMQRQHFTLSNDGYRNLITNLDYGRGITDYLTTRVHWESIQNRASLGMTNYIKLGNIGIVSNSIAANLRNPSQAYLFSLGYSYGDKNVGLNTTINMRGKKFTDIYSYDPKNTKAGNRFTSQTGINYSNSKLGQFFVGFSSSIGSDKTVTRMLTGAYERSITSNLSLRLNVGRNYPHKGRSGSYYLLSMSALLDHYSISLSQSRTGKSKTRDLSISYSPNAVFGTSYRLDVSRGHQTRSHHIEIAKTTRVGNGYIKSHSSGRREAQEIGVSGGIVGIGRSFFMTPQITNSIALVKVGNIPNVSVYYNNNIIGKTNSKGLVLVPNVTPYTDSEVKLEQSELPLDANFTDVKLLLKPKWKSGIVAKFDIQRSKSVMLTLSNEHQEPVPVNYVLKIKGLSDDNYTGFDGKVYVSDVQNITNIDAKVYDEDGNYYCSFEKEVPQDTNDATLDLGSTICKR
ncbi:fimbrial biogenesis outer membrane usher protein [Rickettsiales endosymbiont of Peranema trichophorum]|uniref:fimbria/pilus outer membrane usher protein n=1 Tax=Rickettsiales endosymbiont of Peranema trichophorum TaxID=2486577 RepID=UPI001023B081|nr:fimbria/pilus outer membrane usher protein [Rickettsiales endosymbiont of Peranema trichophorum]RZI47673.1 fimbrial biogenesis outer membrane usher protein [Rickettsiales endosymbiont of Peranema trichophorum]